MVYIVYYIYNAPLRRETVKYPTIFAGVTGDLLFGRVLGPFEDDAIVQPVTLPLPKLHRFGNYFVAVPVDKNGSFTRKARPNRTFIKVSHPVV